MFVKSVQKGQIQFLNVLLIEFDKIVDKFDFNIGNVKYAFAYLRVHYRRTNGS